MASTPAQEDSLRFKKSSCSLRTYCWFSRFNMSRSDLRTNFVIRPAFHLRKLRCGYGSSVYGHKLEDIQTEAYSKAVISVAEYVLDWAFWLPRKVALKIYTPEACLTLGFSLLLLYKYEIQDETDYFAAQAFHRHEADIVPGLMLTRQIALAYDWSTR